MVGTASITEMKRARTGLLGIRSSDDLDIFAQQARGWRQHYDFFGGEAFSGTITEVWIDQLQIFIESSRGQLSVLGSAWRNALFLAIPLEQLEPAVINGCAVCVGDAFIGLGEREWQRYVPSRWSVLTIAMPIDWFEHLPDFDLAVKQIASGCVARRLLVADFRRRAQLAMNCLADPCFSQAAPQIRQSLRQFVVSEVTAAFGRAFGKDQAGIDFYRSIEQAKAVVTELRRSALTDASCAEIVGAIDRDNYRTVHNYVKRLTGCSPHEYVERLKLNALRRALANNRGTVLDAASSWGLWHGGRLAKQYDSLFSELPSATRAKAQAIPRSII